VNTFEASLRERIEMYIDSISNEIIENEKLLDMYKNSDSRQEDVLKYFIERLDIIKKEFEIVLKRI
jgi:hypothetical protein